MNILEKILEEKELAAIKDLIEENEKCLNKCEGVCSSIKNGMCNCNDGVLAQAIRKMQNYLDNVTDINVGSKRLIDANTLNEEVANLFLTITGNHKQSTIVRECKETFRRVIDEQPTVCTGDGWIPYTEQSEPKKDGIYLVTCDDEEYPVKRMRFKECLWYWTYGIYDGKILAWQPLPEPYKGEEVAGE